MRGFRRGDGSGRGKDGFPGCEHSVQVCKLTGPLVLPDRRAEWPRSWTPGRGEVTWTVLPLQGTQAKHRMQGSVPGPEVGSCADRTGPGSL